MLTLKQAAEETGKTKPTILKQIQKGRVRAEKNMKDEWEVDPASLFKLYKPISSELVQEKQREINGNPELVIENSVLKKEIELLKKQIEIYQTTAESLRLDKSFLQEQLKTSTHLLEDLRENKKVKSSSQGFWKRLRGV